MLKSSGLKRERINWLATLKSQQFWFRFFDCVVYQTAISAGLAVLSLFLGCWEDCDMAAAAAGRLLFGLVVLTIGLTAHGQLPFPDPTCGWVANLTGKS